MERHPPDPRGLPYVRGEDHERTLKTLTKMTTESTETEPKLSELLTTAAIYQLDAQDTHQMNVMAEMAASLEAQVKAMREAGNNLKYALCAMPGSGAEAKVIEAWIATASLDTPTPTPPNK